MQFTFRIWCISQFEQAYHLSIVQDSTLFLWSYTCNFLICVFGKQFLGKCDLKHSAPNFSLCFPARFAECWHAYIEPSGNHTRRDTGQRAFCFCTLAFISTRLTQHTAVSPVSSVLRTLTHKKRAPKTHEHPHQLANWTFAEPAIFYA